MHAESTVYCADNPVQIPRIDVNLAFDAIFTEMNSRSLGEVFLVSSMSLLKPATMWTTSPPADSNFESLLLHGVYPMAPAPSGDHSLGLNGMAQFLKYGPMLRALHGRVWNLAPHAISCAPVAAQGPQRRCLANMFDVPGDVLIAVAVLTDGGKTIDLLSSHQQGRRTVGMHHPPPPPPPASGVVAVQVARSLAQGRKVELLQVGRDARWVAVGATNALKVEKGIILLRYTI